VIRRCTLIGLLLWLLCPSAMAEQSGTLLPAIPPAVAGDSCVEPTDVMRRNHMRFLMHQRDDTVRSGIRGARHSLVGCIDCHVQKNADGAAIPVNAEGQFCASCHGFAGVSMDCFECHASVPVKQQVRATLPQWMSSPSVTVANATSPGTD
jgi:hypothetical protein